MLADNGLIAKEYTDIICYGKQSVRRFGRLPELPDAERVVAAGYSAPRRPAIFTLVELAI
jgi:hypothetical protein